MGYGVREEHFKVFGKALKKVLKNQLADLFTPQVEEAWATVFDIITEKMTNGRH